MEEINILTSKVLGLALEVHTQLGAGLLESTYETCLFHEIIEADIKVERQKKSPTIYKGSKLDIDHRLDLLIDDRLVIELRSVEVLLSVYSAQTLTYMKLSNIRYGLLLDFSVASLKYGIKCLILQAN